MDHPVRVAIESEALRAIQNTGEQRDRDSIAVAWLKTARVSDESRWLAIFRYLRGTDGMIDVLKARYASSRDLDHAALTAVRACSTHSREQLFFALAQAARAAAERGVDLSPGLRAALAGMLCEIESGIASTPAQAM